jgi:hypothetical protein
LVPPALLTAWNTDKRFSTPYGVALDLPLDSSATPRNFSDLVSAVAPGSDAEMVLDQLLAAGCVEVVAGYVRCTNRAYIPRGVSTDRIARFGAILSAFAATGVRNLMLEIPQEGGYLERAVQSDFPISDHGRAVLLRWLSTEGVQFLEQLDAFINRSRDQMETPDGRRVGIDLFMYDVPEEVRSSKFMQQAGNA